MSEHTHRYGDSEDTSRVPPYHPESAPSGPPTHTTVLPPPPPGGWAQQSRPDRRPGARTAGLLVAALLLGTAGGVAAAAGYDAVNGGDGTTASSPLQTADTGSATGSTSQSNSVEKVARVVLPSVVKINVAGQQGAGSGSGIILSSDGEILTNNHVAEIAANGGRMTVNFNDGSTANARIVGTDPSTDLAVVKAEGVSGLTPATLGNSDKLAVGEEVVAVGSPFGLDSTVTDGIVSALNRPVSVSNGSSGGGTATAYPAIQTDAAINPGNSGGPLVNLAGQVVGINSSIYSTSETSGGQAGSIGLGFSIPISKVLPVIEQLRQGQTPTHARLGVTVSNDQSSNGLLDGAAIQSVTSGSAADKAGLKAGDVVTKVDNEQITGVESLIATIRGYRPGDQVTLTVQRGNQTLTLHATLDSDAAGT